jgi:hypothetical protein
MSYACRLPLLEEVRGIEVCGEKRTDVLGDNTGKVYSTVK